MKHALYVGKDPKFKNKCALIMDDPEADTALVLAQFDDCSLKEAYGWHSFEATEFEIEEDVFEDE